MNYNKAVDYIDNISAFGSRLDLSRIRVLLDSFGNPQDKIKVIHVAGTNGKGSVCSMLSNILIEEGYNTALYTSPHLERHNERYAINNIQISDRDFAEYVNIIKERVNTISWGNLGIPTVFEQLTAMAFVYFYDKKVDYAVIEVGLGGRFDATNIIKKPILSIIASISLDHTEYLGETLEKIAFEKGGIIKDGCPVALYTQGQSIYDVIKKLCDEKGCKLYYLENQKTKVKKESFDGSIISYENSLYSFDNVMLPLIGEYQINNCSLVLLAAYALNEGGVVLSRESILSGIRKTRWNGRMEVCGREPLVVIDGAHNPDGIHMLARSVKECFEGKRLVLLMGVLGDKDYENMAAEIIPLADTVVITRPASERALSVDEFKKVVNKYCDRVYGFEDIKEAYDYALGLTGKDDVLLCAGSLYLIGHIRTLIMGGK